MVETLLDISIFALQGMIGGAVRGVVGVSKSVYKNKKIKVSKIIYGIIASVIAGALAAVITEGDWRISILAGYAGSDLLESLYKTRLFGMFK